jgi:alpha-glucosidase
MDFKTTVPAEVMGARARQLAMTVVYPSPLLVLCDSPKNYRGQAGIEFLREIPTVWDESVVLSGERWYLAAMSGDDAAQLTAGLNVLGNRRPADYETTRVKSHLSLCFSFLAGFEHN